ncbi:MAG: NAD kinase [Prolixibacteraceae bacterium]|nr:NAD kinase [Prolixibacteraceae bacterium]
MKIAVYGQPVNRDYSGELSHLFSILKQENAEVYIYEPFYRFMKSECHFLPDVTAIFNSGRDLPEDVKFLFSIGGDGTFLKSILTIKNKSVPVVGINTGRLGFLSDIPIDEIDNAFEQITSGKYSIDERAVLEIEAPGNAFGDFNYALNEVVVAKQDSGSMITIHASINGEYLNTYWADGLIIATPTGSTAYSLSVGGPILTPDSENIVISPIAPHNLTVRPILIPDHHLLTLKIEGRGHQFLATVDSRSETFDFPGTLKIRKAGFKIKTLRLHGHTFYSTLRNKLMWGLDKRN